MSTFIRPHSLALVGPYSGKTKALYRDYLQKHSFVPDITDPIAKVQYAISENTREIIATREQLQEHGFEVLESIDSGIAEVNQTLGEVDQTLKGGFALLSYGLEDVSNGITKLTAKCDWGFSRMIAEIGHVNDTLNELLAVAKTPAQTWAYNQFEIGRDAMRQELYPEALEAILRAISGFGDQTGYKLEYRFHYNLGIIYLGDVNNADSAILDLAKAEQAFLAAARYAKADFPSEASVAFTAAGWAAYCQVKFPEAETHILQAIQLDASSENPEAYFQLAKIQMRTDRPDEALPRLQKAIEMDRNYMLKAATDEDFLKYERPVQDLFEQKRARSAIIAVMTLNMAKKSLEVMKSWHTSEKFPEEAKSIESNFHKAVENFNANTYFGYLDAITPAAQVQNAADALVEAQKDRLSSRVVRLDASIKENRSRLTAKATRFSIQEWQKAEAAYSQIAYPLTFPSFSYGDYQNQIDRLIYVNKLYEKAETSAQSIIDESISIAESKGKVIGGAWAGIVGGIVGAVIGFGVGLVVLIVLSIGAIFGFPRGLASLVTLMIWVLGPVAGCIIGARFGSSEWGRDWRRRREAKVRREIGE
jgi:tetratricopeptide (TPR) repeat protein